MHVTISSVVITIMFEITNVSVKYFEMLETIKKSGKTLNKRFN